MKRLVITIAFAGLVAGWTISVPAQGGGGSGGGCATGAGGSASGGTATQAGKAGAAAAAGQAGAPGAANRPAGVVTGQGSGVMQPNTGIGQPNTGIGQPNNALYPNTGIFDPTRTPGGTNIFGTNNWWGTNWRTLNTVNPTNPGLLPGQNQSGVLRPSGTLGGTNMNVLPGRGVGVGTTPARPGAPTPGTTTTGPGGTTVVPPPTTGAAPGTSAGGSTTR